MFAYSLFSISIKASSSFPTEKNLANIPKSLNTLGHDPGLYLFSKEGGAITSVLPLSCPASIAAT